MSNNWPEQTGFESEAGQRALKRLRSIKCIICHKVIPLGSKGRKYCGSQKCKRELWRSIHKKRRENGK
jgi:hypothetical protein